MFIHNDFAKQRSKAILALTDFKNWAEQHDIDSCAVDANQAYVQRQPPLFSPMDEVLQHTVISPLPSQPYCSPLWVSVLEQQRKGILRTVIVLDGFCFASGKQTLEPKQLGT